MTAQEFKDKIMPHHGVMFRVAAVSKANLVIITGKISPKVLGSLIDSAQ